MEEKIDTEINLFNGENAMYHEKQDGVMVFDDESGKLLKFAASELLLRNTRQKLLQLLRPNIFEIRGRSKM